MVTFEADLIIDVKIIRFSKTSTKREKSNAPNPIGFLRNDINLTMTLLHSMRSNLASNSTCFQLTPIQAESWVRETSYAISNSESF